MSVASLWIGDALGPIEVASVNSFLRTHGEFTLYSYDAVANVPDGVSCRDAREVFDAGQIIRHHKTGSPALHSDIFRYQLLKKTDHIWVDLDIIAFKRFDLGGDWIFAPEAPDYYNGAVLKLPKTSKTLNALAAVNHDTIGIPLHLTGLRRLKFKLRALCFGALPITRWPWGALGPAGLTHYLTQNGECENALAGDTFYHIPIADVRRFVEPGALTQADFPETAWGVHLWGKELRAVITAQYSGVIPKGSYLRWVMDNYGADDLSEAQVQQPPE